jgi:hypothetical protein
VVGLKYSNLMKQYLHGQSLFEVMFAVAVAAIIMMSVVSLSKQTISSADFSKNNALASRYSQEATDWVREERDNDWITFYNRANTNPTVCLESLAWGGSPPCPDMTGTVFNRTVTLQQVDLDGNLGDESVEAEVIVTWTDGRGMHQVSVISRLTNWNI